MKKFAVVAIVLAITLVTAHAASANPFYSGRPSPVNAGFMGAFATPFVQDLVAVQTHIHQAITEQVELLKQGKSLVPLWTLLLMSLAYGIFHVLAPGHGKVIVGSYFLGNKADWRDGVWAGLLMAIGHTVTAIGIVTVLYLIFGLGQFAVLDNARYMELAGYGMIAAIGLWLLWRAFRNEPECGVCGKHHCDADDYGHGHDHRHVTHELKRMKRPSTGLFAASLVPCTGSMIILLFTLANNLLWAGILAVIMIALGMWLTITAIGIASMMLRRVVVGDEEHHGSKLRLGLAKASRVVAALIVIATGSLLFAGTLFSMMG